VLYISKKTITILLSVIVLIFSGVGVYAAAQQSNDSQILNACTKENGQIRLVDESTKCGPNEEKISWNVEGPVGPMGAQGPAGKDGADGKDGAAGPQGPPGVSLPAGEGNSILNYDVYLKLGTIEGESTTEPYENWIELTGVEFDASRVISGGAGGGVGTGKASLNEFVVKKSYESSSIPIFQEMLSGKHIPDGKIVFVSRGDTPTPILTIELKDIQIANYNFDNAFETIGLHFSKIKSTYSGVTDPITGEFDFKENK
jgi:type VI protein secretion system component Hcp